MESSAMRSDKDVWPESGGHGYTESETPTLPSSTPSRYRRKRWSKRLTSLPLVSRTARLLRWILGPSQPLSDSELPPPHPSLSLNFTFGSRSRHLPLDAPVVEFSRRARLHYALYPFIALWATLFILLIRQQYYNAGPEPIACNAAVWDNWPPDVCGLNGTVCEDYLEEGTYRCMGGCLDTTLGNPRWIGGEEINGVPLVIGGEDGRYRADSWVCPSAIHRGLISRYLGGCVTVWPVAFNSSPGSGPFIGSKANGVNSTSFLPDYPGAYELVSDPSGGCIDLHPVITGINAICLLLLTLFLSPPPSVLFSILLLLGWAQITLLSNPRYAPPHWDYILGGLPAVIFAGYWFYKVSFKRTLYAFRDLPVETAIWQGIGYWIGLESSTIFSKLPVQRLGYGQLSPEGVITIIIIVVLVLVVVLVQAWQARKFGLLQYYILRYLPLVPILIILAFIPDYTLRLHHYLLATIAIPVLSLPNRVSLFGQAFALGLFLDGVGRWGWDSILEYTASLLGDAVAGTGAPAFMANMSTSENITWFPITPALFEEDYNGVAVIVDDILRGGNITENTFSFAALNLSGGMDHFFRLAFDLGGITQDYTDPITLYQNGTWQEIL